MNNPFSIFKNIKVARINSGLSQKDLAEKLGVSDKTISAYETGRAIPPTHTLAKIADLTSVPIQNIIEQENGGSNLPSRLKNIEKRLSAVEKQRGKTTKINNILIGALIRCNKNFLLLRENDRNILTKGKWTLPLISVYGNFDFITSVSNAAKSKTNLKVIVGPLLGCFNVKKTDNSVFLIFEATTKLKNIDNKPITKKNIQLKWFNEKELHRLDKNKLFLPGIKQLVKTSINNEGLKINNFNSIELK